MVLGALVASQPSQFDEFQAYSRPCLKRDEKDTQGCPLVSKEAHMYVHTYIKNSLVYSDNAALCGQEEANIVMRFISSFSSWKGHRCTIRYGLVSNIV